MRASLVPDLVCPLSRDSLRLEPDDSADVATGRLDCMGDSCRHTWEIRDGIPRLVPPDLVPQQLDTASAFGWQWQHFAEFHPEFEEQFLDWLEPIDRESFAGKRILDAGCGTGRHAYLAARFGASEVVALDLSGAVDAARDNLAEIDNVHVVQGDLLRLPFHIAAEGGGFDLIYSIGVLHHLPDPYAGFRSLLPYLRPGGVIAVWLYGYENNGFVRHVVEPLRKVTTRMSRPSLRAVAWPLGVAFDAAAKGVYRPLRSTRLGKALPLNEYMTSVADYSFRQNYGIVFDQLSAPTAAYIEKEEIEDWFAGSGLTDVRISHRHGNSWRGSGRAPG
jgi:SAM-dependent methyltransferase